MKIQSGFKPTSVFVPKKLYSNQELHQTISNTISADRLSHAYLFCGTKGIGKKTFAVHLAASILCSGKIKPCGKCKSCKKAFSQNHPDIILCNNKRGTNAIHIETIRHIRQDAYVMPNESTYKIYIIPNVEDMSQGAANAFLKVLEEPPLHVIFLLTTDNSELVLETIRSRCILQKLYPMTDKNVELAVTEILPNKTFSEIHSAAKIANGILGRAIEILENPDFEEITSLSNRLTAGLASKNEYEILVSLYQASHSKEKLQKLLERTSHTLHETLSIKLSLHTEHFFDSLSEKLTLKQLETAFFSLEEARAAINSNVNLGLLVNHVTINLMKAISKG